LAGENEHLNLNLNLNIAWDNVNMHAGGMFSGIPSPNNVFQEYFFLLLFFSFFSSSSFFDSKICLHFNFLLEHHRFVLYLLPF
jgi:hypothetical protein